MAARVHHPHAPEVGWVRRYLGAFHVTGVFWYRFTRWGIIRLPYGGLGIAVVIFTTFFFLFLWNIRKAIASNLEAILGPCGWWRRQVRIYRTMWDFAWCLGERHERLGGKAELTARVEGDEAWQQASEAGEGVIFVTAHIGQWEMSPELAASKVRRRVHVVREEELDPRAQQFVEELIREHGDPLCTTHFATDDPRLGLVLASALRQGELVALQGDRPRANSRALTATLFGRPMPLPIGPAALSRAAGARIFPVFSFREGRRRYRVVIRPPIEVLSGGKRDEEVAVGTQRIAEEIEWAIREAPHQWFCFRRLW